MHVRLRDTLLQLSQLSDQNLQLKSEKEQMVNDSNLVMSKFRKNAAELLDTKDERDRLSADNAALNKYI